jgi:hypothetical protein
MGFAHFSVNNKYLTGYLVGRNFYSIIVHVAFYRFLMYFVKRYYFKGTVQQDLRRVKSGINR